MTLFRHVHPLPDESLAGLVARAAAINIYPRAYDVLVQAGMERGRPEAVAMRGSAAAETLGKVLGTDAEKLIPLFHPAIGSGKFDFFGIAVRSIHRESKRRRVSPRGLKQSPHVRAVWHLRPFSFDPGTKEQLLSECPICDKPLGFSLTKGVTFCDHCVAPGRFGELWGSVDLRDFPQPIVEVDDIEALDFVTGLVDPHPAVRCSFAPSLHDDLAGLDRGELFEMVLSIGNGLLLNTDPGYTTSAALPARARAATLQPDMLAKAGRSLLGWPRAFADLLSEARADAGRRSAQWGKTKEFGALGNVSNDPHLSSSARKLASAQIERLFIESPLTENSVRKRGKRDSDLYVGARELQDVTGRNTGLIAKLARHPGITTYRVAPAPAPLVFVRMQVMPVLRRYRDLVSELSVAFDIGVPVETMRDFDAAGYFERASGVENQLASSPVNYSRSQIDALFGFYLEIVPVIGKTDDFVGFKDVMQMFPAGRKPWFALWELILQGRIDSHLRRPKTKALTDVVEVRRSSIDPGALVRRMTELPVPDIDAVTIGNVQLMLGMPSYRVFQACVEADLLTPSVTDKTVPYSKVMEFAARFIQPPEIAARAGVTRLGLVRWLEDRGAKPWRSLNVKGGQIYERDEVDPLLPQ